MNEHLKVFKKEIELIYRSESHAPKRGALITAALKRMKTNYMCSELIAIAERESVDLTTTLAAKIIKRITGKSAAMGTLLAHFASPGRTAHDKSQDFNRIDDLVKAHKNRLNKDLRRLSKEAAIAKDNVKMEMVKARFSDIDDEDLVDGETFFKELEEGRYD
ncbi:hypothetical protein AB3Y13_22920 [Vibrio alginolyticus]